MRGHTSVIGPPQSWGSQVGAQLLIETLQTGKKVFQLVDTAAEVDGAHALIGRAFPNFIAVEAKPDDVPKGSLLYRDLSCEIAPFHSRHPWLRDARLYVLAGYSVLTIAQWGLFKPDDLRARFRDIRTIWMIEADRLTVTLTRNAARSKGSKVTRELNISPWPDQSHQHNPKPIELQTPPAEHPDPRIGPRGTRSDYERIAKESKHD